MAVFENFDRIIIINLPQRTDRRREMDQELEGIALANDPKVRYFPAIRPTEAGRFYSIGARGCYESHKQILREAANSNKSVLILEDDCEFVAGAHLYEIPKHWDIFYGGYTASIPDELHDSDIMGSHMMGFSRNGAKAVSDYLELLDCDGSHPPVDAAYVWFRRAYPEISTHFAVPSLAGQRASRSDIVSLRWFDRLPIFQQLANFLRRMREKKFVKI